MPHFLVTYSAHFNVFWLLSVISWVTCIACPSHLVQQELIVNFMSKVSKLCIFSPLILFMTHILHQNQPFIIMFVFKNVLFSFLCFFLVKPTVIHTDMFVNSIGPVNAINMVSYPKISQ